MDDKPSNKSKSYEKGNKEFKSQEFCERHYDIGFCHNNSYNLQELKHVFIEIQYNIAIIYTP